MYCPLTGAAASTSTTSPRPLSPSRRQRDRDRRRTSSSSRWRRRRCRESDAERCGFAIVPPIIIMPPQTPAQFNPMFAQFPTQNVCPCPCPQQQQIQPAIPFTNPTNPTNPKPKQAPVYAGPTSPVRRARYDSEWYAGDE